MAIVLQENTVRLTAVLRLRDVFSGGAPVGELDVGLVENERRPILNPEGYVLFIDLPEGNYTLRVNAQYYELNETIVFNPADMDVQNAAVDVPLVPKPSYPFPATATLLRGLVRDPAGQALAGVQVQLVDGPVARTGADGRYVFFFEAPAGLFQTVNLTKTGYNAQSDSVALVAGATVILKSTMIAVDDPQAALLELTVTDDDGDPVTQALVEVPAYGQSDRTDLAGRAVLVLSPAGASESVVLRVNQQGFHEANVNRTVHQGQTTTTTVSMNLNLTDDTATLRVRTRLDHHYAGGVLVEVLEKNRAALSNPGDKRATFYFDDLASDEEDVTLRVSKEGYEEETRVVEIEKDRVKNYTVDLDSPGGHWRR